MSIRANRELIETAATTYLTVAEADRGEFVADLLDSYRRLSSDDLSTETNAVTRTSLDFGAAVLARADDLELTGMSGLVLA
jgi:hypothetical protein